MSDIATQLSDIMRNLLAAIWAHAPRDRARSDLFLAVFGRVSRMNQRLAALFVRWRAGTLPKPRPSRAGQPTKPRERLRLPNRRYWLSTEVPHASSFGSQLQHLLGQPDFAEFLRAVPQACRILRPLCYLLSVAPTVLPPRPVIARPSRPSTAQPSKRVPQKGHPPAPAASRIFSPA